MKAFWLAWLIGTIILGYIGAQDQPVKGKGVAAQDLPEPQLPREGECSWQNSGTRDLCDQATQEGYRYLIFAYRHRQSSFDWNLAANKIIFGAVLVLVFAGLVFAAIQFRIALATSPTSEASEAGAQRPGRQPDPPGEPPTHQSRSMRTHVEISAGGVKATSSVLGVIILLISMAFFYLYARYVYPLYEVGADQPESSQRRPL